MERGNGVRSLDVSCWNCHHRSIMSADLWPGHVPVPSFAPRMVCTRCGIIVADARPNVSLLQSSDRGDAVAGELLGDVDLNSLCRCDVSLAAGDIALS